MLLSDYEVWSQSSSGSQRILLGMGCFFGAQAHLAGLEGVLETTVGKATGTQVTDATGLPVTNLVPLEVVDVLFDPDVVSLSELLASFFEYHHCFLDPEIYTPAHVRSCIFATNNEQLETAETLRHRYGQRADSALGLSLSTVVGLVKRYELADESLQEYHRKHPGAIEHKRSNGLTMHAL